MRVSDRVHSGVATKAMGNDLTTFRVFLVIKGEVSGPEEICQSGVEEMEVRHTDKKGDITEVREL